MKLLVSAAEASSDAHGASLVIALRALLSERGEKLEVIGVGGPLLRATGQRQFFHARDLLSMGFTEVLARLPKIFRALRVVTATAQVEKPDVAVLIDYPDFHLRLAKRLKGLGISTVNFIPPKIWLWRRHRIKKMRAVYDRVLCILPFEEAFYAENSMSALYVGNPLVDQLPLKLSQEQARRELGLPVTGAKVVALFLGSRPHELAMHITPMSRAVLRVARERQVRTIALVPLATPEQRSWVERELAPLAHSEVEFRFYEGESARCLVAAEAGLVKSGTSTLEAGMLGLPHVVVYKTSRSTAWIFKYLMKYLGPVGLVNLVGGWRPGDSWEPATRRRIVPEILTSEVTVERLAQELDRLLFDAEYIAKMKSAFQEMRGRVLGDGSSPSLKAAREILRLYDEKRTS